MRTDVDRDVIYETFEADRFNGGVRDKRIVKRDMDDDGSFDWRQVSEFNVEGELTGRRTDSDNDGTLDRIETYRYSPISDGGRKLEVEIDDGADGTIDIKEIKNDYDSDGSFDFIETVEFNESGQRVRSTGDRRADGTLDWIATYQYEQLAGGGRVRVLQLDDDADGTVDRVERKYYVSGVKPDYVVYDGSRTGDRSDGTADRLVFPGRVFSNGRDFEYTIDGSDAALAGITGIVLAYYASSTRLILTDSGMAGLAAGAENYLLIIDGEHDDTVRFVDDSVQATGQTIGGRDEYRHSSGRILIDSDVEVTGATKPAQETAMPDDSAALALLLANLAGATVEMFELAGITGVNDDNLDDVKIVIGAYGDAASTLTSVQVQSLTDIVAAGIAGWHGDDVESATVDSDSMTLEISSDVDDDIEYRVVLGLDSSTLAPASMMRTIELGKIHKLREGYKWNHLRQEDHDYDGTLDREVWLWDEDGNGTFEYEETEALVNGILRFEFSNEDDDQDGTFDQKYETYYNDQGKEIRFFEGRYAEGVLVSTREILYHDNGERSRTEHDWNADGTPEWRLTYDENGRMVGNEIAYNSGLSRISTWSYHDSGAVDVHTLDSNGDGTIDLRKYYNTRGWLVQHEDDYHSDGTVDQLQTWSYYSNGYVASHEMDRDADGTVDRRTSSNQEDMVNPTGPSDSQFRNFQTYLEAFNDAKAISADDMTLEQLENLAAVARGVKIVSHWRLNGIDAPEIAHEALVIEEEENLTLRVYNDPLHYSNSDSTSSDIIEIGLDVETFANLGEYRYVSKTTRHSVTSSTIHVWNDEEGLTKRIWETDNGSDGTIDSRRIATYSGWTSGRETRRLEKDGNADGTPNEVHLDLDGDNAYDLEHYDTNDDGTIDYTIIIEPGVLGLSWMVNRVEFTDGVNTEGRPINFLYNQNLDGDTVVDLAGIEDGTNGASEVYISDRLLEMAVERWNPLTGEESFGLTINGDSNDKVVLKRDGIRRIEDADDAMGNGMHIYEATYGRLYIDPDVTVEFV